MLSGINQYKLGNLFIGFKRTHSGPGSEIEGDFLA